MKKIFFCTSCLICLTVNIQALLPPLYQSVNEYQAILEDPKLGSSLGSEQSIESIQKTSDGYLIQGRDKQVEVKLIRELQDHPGPAHFQLSFGDVTTIEH